MWRKSRCCSGLGLPVARGRFPVFSTRSWTAPGDLTVELEQVAVIDFSAAKDELSGFPASIKLPGYTIAEADRIILQTLNVASLAFLGTYHR